jgi:hypothetical protein
MTKGWIGTKISCEAKHWAVRELARRAGVTPEQFEKWSIEFSPDSTVILVDRFAGKRIRIAAHDGLIVQKLPFELFTNSADWMVPPPEGLARLVPSFVVPFSPVQSEPRPIFSRLNSNMVVSGFDLVTSSLFTLARAEEVAPGPRDGHGRFVAKASVAFRDGFLDRPIVDEYGLAFAQAIESLVPGWKPTRGPLAVKLSHDIDDLDVMFSGRPEHIGFCPKQLVRAAWMGTPLSFRSAIQETTKKHEPLSTIKSLAGSATRTRPNARELVRELCRLSTEFQLDSAFYWKASPLTPFDSGYDPCSKSTKLLIQQVADQGFENGVHPGYYTFQDVNELRREVACLREATGREVLGGRQHYLRWSPETWKHWEQCGLAYDSSLTFVDVCGFRAGTCVPYKPWLLDENREAGLLEIPLIIMEMTLTECMRETRPEVLLEIIESYMNKCRTVGGVFTFLYHNASLQDAMLKTLYERLLQKFAGCAKFDWHTAIAQQWAGNNEHMRDLLAEDAQTEWRH